MNLNLYLIQETPPKLDKLAEIERKWSAFCGDNYYDWIAKVIESENGKKTI